MTESTALDRLDRLPALSELRAMESRALARCLEDSIGRQVQSCLDVPPAHRLWAQRPLRSMGVDSLLALRLKRRLESALQIALPLPRVLQDSSLAQLAGVLAARVQAAAVPAGAER